MKRDRGSSAGRRANGLLAAGAALGIALAAIELLRGAPSSDALPPDAVAAVNGAPVSRDDYRRAVDGIAAGRREPIGDADRRRILDRLVDEELLVQRGLDLGLVRRDPRLRGELVAAVIDFATAEAAAREVSRADLEQFYEANRDYFADAGRVRVRQILVRVPPGGDEAAARQRAAEAARRLRAGEEFSSVAAALGDPEPAPLPDALLPPAKLREYLGPTASRTALDLPVGERSDPVRSSAGYHVLEVVERDAGTAPPLDEIEDQVRAEMARRAADDALRAYLDELRGSAHVVTAQDATQPLGGGAAAAPAPAGRGGGAQ